MKYLDTLANYLRKPRREFLAGILKNLGVSEKDPFYDELRDRLASIIGHRSNEQKFFEYFKLLSKQLYEKMNKELTKRDKRVRELEMELKESERQGKLVVTTTMEKALSPRILTLVDLPSYEILALLKDEEKNYELLKSYLKSYLKLKDSDLKWRINYLKELGIIDTNYPGNAEIYSLSALGKTILEKRGADFAKSVEATIDKRYKLAQKAVGGDDAQAKRLLDWIDGRKGKDHKTVIEKLNKKLKDPKKISQSFFNERKGGNTHEKHIGVRIVDHGAAGELLLSYLINSS